MPQRITRRRLLAAVKAEPGALVRQNDIESLQSADVTPEPLQEVLEVGLGHELLAAFHLVARAKGADGVALPAQFKVEDVGEDYARARRVHGAELVNY